MSEARVIAPSPSAHSFFSSRSIRSIATDKPSEGDLVVTGMSQSPPAASITREQLIRFFRPPRTGGVKCQGRCIFLRPRVLNRVNESPCFFNFVTAGEQRGVTAHGIE